MKNSKVSKVNISQKLNSNKSAFSIFLWHYLNCWGPHGLTSLYIIYTLYCTYIYIYIYIVASARYWAPRAAFSDTFYVKTMWRKINQLKTLCENYVKPILWYFYQQSPARMPVGQIHAIKPIENQPLWTTTVIWCPYINKYQYISTYINTYQQICSNLNKYQCISTNTYKYQYISTYINTCQQICSNLNKYQCISTDTNAYQQISIHISKYQQIYSNMNKYACISANSNRHQYISPKSLHINKYIQILAHTNIYQQISTNINAYQQISIHISNYIQI
jgi:hypothetical protein